MQSSLYNNRNHADARQKALVEEVKGMFSKDFKEHYMMTCTRAKYQSNGQDIIMHNYGNINKPEIKTTLVGDDGFVNAACGFEDPIEALLGTRNLAEVEQACEWVSGQKPYLYRINQTPNEEKVRAVVFGLSVDDWFYINVNYGIINNVPARGVVASRAKKTP